MLRRRGLDQPERAGLTTPANARRLADAERNGGSVPPGSEWLDPQTADDLDLPLVFDSVDRTLTTTGAQALWRWLAAPVIERGVIEARDRSLELMGDPALQQRIAKALPEVAEVDAEQMPELLWRPQPVLGRSKVALAILAALIVLLALLFVNTNMIAPLLLVASCAIVYDLIAQRDLAQYAYSVGVLGTILDGAARLAHIPGLPAELRGDIDRDLEIRPLLNKKLLLLRMNDPFGLCELLRAALLIRVFTVQRCMTIVEAERDRLRRIVLWVGELDAARSVARLRTERGTAVPVTCEDMVIEARQLVHPAVPNAVDNDVTVTGGLLITGSNASGKSTFLRAVAINAVLAQTLRLTYGSWRAPLMRVRTAMRINDDVARGLSTYAAEVATVGQLVQAADDDDMPVLFLLDEPFHGTNPHVRVPIVVAVLEYLVADHLVLAATHDLDVANLVSPRFERCYFTELATGGFDRKLTPGVAPTSNALALLERAGYPAEIMARIAELSGGAHRSEAAV